MSEVFPNAPLKEAVFQLRFTGELSVEAGRAAIQSAVRSELPKLYVPRAVAGQALSLQAVELRSDDEDEIVGLALNSFSYHSKRYEGFAKFRERFGRFWSVFSAHVRVARLTRAGLRYINHIPILRPSEAAPIPVHDYVNIGFRLPDSLSGSLTHLDSAFVVRLEEGALRIVVQHKKLDTPSSEILLLDFDFAQQDGLSVDDVDVYLTRAHEHTKRIFLELISEKYLAVMRSGR